MYLASVGKHNFYVLLTRMSRFEFRDYQQCCSFFFFSLHSTFSCCSILAIERIRTRLTVKLSRVYIFLWIPKVENEISEITIPNVVSIVEIIDILCAAFIFFHQKNRIIFRRVLRYLSIRSIFLEWSSWRIDRQSNENREWKLSIIIFNRKKHFVQIIFFARR